ALAASTRALSATPPHTPTAASTHAGSPAHLASAGDGPAPGAGGRRRPALGRSLNARAAHPAPRPGAHRPPRDAAHLSSRVHGPLERSRAPAPAHAQPLRAPLEHQSMSKSHVD